MTQNKLQPIMEAVNIPSSESSKSINRKVMTIFGLGSDDAIAKKSKNEKKKSDGDNSQLKTSRQSRASAGSEESEVGADDVTSWRKSSKKELLSSNTTDITKGSSLTDLRSPSMV
jgi:hypothetical protein